MSVIVKKKKKGESVGKRIWRIVSAYTCANTLLSNHFFFFFHQGRKKNPSPLLSLKWAEAAEVYKPQFLFLCSQDLVSARGRRPPYGCPYNLHKLGPLLLTRVQTGSMTGINARACSSHLALFLWFGVFWGDACSRYPMGWLK